VTCCSSRGRPESSQQPGGLPSGSQCALKSSHHPKTAHRLKQHGPPPIDTCCEMFLNHQAGDRGPAARIDQSSAAGSDLSKETVELRLTVHLQAIPAPLLQEFHVAMKRGLEPRSVAPGWPGSSLIRVVVFTTPHRGYSTDAVVHVATCRNHRCVPCSAAEGAPEWSADSDRNRAALTSLQRDSASAPWPPWPSCLGTGSGSRARRHRSCDETR
jgi:hypothetical protein